MKFSRLKNLKARLSSNVVVKNTIKNTSWLMGDKIITMIIGVFVTALVARYFGPERYGEFNYALAFVALFTAISTLGLETLTVKSILDKEFDEGTILYTSLIMRIIGGVVLSIFSFLIIIIIEPSDSNIHFLVLIMSFVMVAKSLEVIEYWIQAHQKAKISSIVRIIVYIISSSLKIMVVIFEGNLIHYALVYLFDAILIGIGLSIAYKNSRIDRSVLKFSIKYAKSVLSQSWYLIISGLMVALYMKIDQVMLGYMLQNKTELGFYSAAVHIASLWYFVPMAIIVSFKPVIFNNKRQNEISYLKSIHVLYSVIIWLSITFAVFIVFTSNILVKILYGNEFIKAAEILTISAWAGIFAMIGMASSVWLVSQNLQKYNTIFVLFGAISNITLNIIFIPKFGGTGAAIATLLSQIITNILTPLLFRKTRTNIKLVINSTLLVYVNKK